MMQATEFRLGFRPLYGAFDAAFGTFYVYNVFHSKNHDGFAAVPFSEKGGTISCLFYPHGLPICAAGLPMPSSSLSLTAPIPSSSTNAASTSVPYCSPICMQIYARWIISAGLRAVALLTCPPVSTLVCAINSIGIVRLTNRSTNSAPLPSGFAHLLMCRNR
jgi:hypothetical protein